jgi:hypothetical protein
LQSSSESNSPADEESDHDDFNASEDEGSGSDFEESEGRAFQLRVTFDNDSHFYLQGEDWDELERKAAKCKANLFRYKSQLIAPTSQRTRNEQKVVALRTTSRMTTIDRRKRPQQSRRSLQLMARANAENNASPCATPPCYIRALCFLYVQ